jgi:hypothetical protein
MKYIKTFEKLSPDTYIRAGEGLKAANKYKRGSEMKDYGLKKKWGFYNMHYGNRNSIFCRDSTFTDPYCKFYFGDAKYGSNLNLTEDDVVQKWISSGCLCVTFEFYFRPTEETRRKNPTTLKSLRVPMFSIVVYFSNWQDGLASWLDYEGDATTNEIDMYEESKILTPVLNKPTDQYYFGIFSDRESALKFRRQLPSLIDPYKGKVMDMLSILNASADDIEKYDYTMGQKTEVTQKDSKEEVKIKLTDKLRTNFLYYDEPIDSNMDSVWFNKILI